MVTDDLSSSEEASQAIPWRRWLVRAVVALTLMMLLYLSATIWAARGDLAHAFDKLPLEVLMKAIGLVLLGLGLRAARWHYYVRRLDWPVPLGTSIIAFLASFAFTATPGKLGEGIKLIFLRTRHNVPLADGFGVLIVERLGDLLAVLILAAGGLALLADALVYFILIAALIAGVTLVVGSRRIYEPLLGLVGRVPQLTGLSRRVLRMLHASRALLRPLPFLVGVGIAVVAWSCEGLAFHLIIQRFNVQFAFVESCSIFGLATLIGALSALPGGLGSFEAVMILLLKRKGLSVAAATLPVVVFRWCTLWLGSLIGVLFMFGWLWRTGSSLAGVVARESQ